MGKFIPRYIPSNVSSDIPIGTLLWYFGKIEDIDNMPNWAVADGTLCKLSEYPGMKGMFKICYCGDFYCGISHVSQFYRTKTTTTSKTKRDTSKWYVKLNTGYYECIEPEIRTSGVFNSRITDVVKQLSSGCNDITNSDLRSHVRGMLNLKKSTAYICKYVNDAWDETEEFQYLTNQNRDGYKRWAWLSDYYVHSVNSHDWDPTDYDFAAVQKAWNDLNSKSVSYKQWFIDNFLWTDDTRIPKFKYLENGVEKTFTSTESNAILRIKDINSQLINKYEIGNTSWNSAYDSTKYASKLPDLMSRTVIGTRDNNMVSAYTNGELPALGLSGSFCGTTGSTSGVFSGGSENSAYASGHNGITIRGSRITMNADSTSGLYKKGVKQVTPAAYYAIPIIRIK